MRTECSQGHSVPGIARAKSSGFICEVHDLSGSHCFLMCSAILSQQAA